jgi:hypothetical protein
MPSDPYVRGWNLVQQRVDDRVLEEESVTNRPGSYKWLS